MLSRIFSGAVQGIDAYMVEVETFMEGNVPYFGIVGLPDNTVRESKERVVSAIKNSGYKFVYDKRIVINLAPAGIKKEGPAYDLPIALGIMSAQGEISEEKLEDTMIVGELAMDGNLRAVRGILPIAMQARKKKLRNILVPKKNAREAAVAGKDINVFPVETLNDAINHLNNRIIIEPHHECL